ncbi:MAG: flagellar basal body-associated FliL family protein [Proteobacteria bacterium]|nr:flagellar basal body-associated FliL family protein [Pseudomonadota bacterium]
MAEEKNDAQKTEEKPKKSKKLLLIIIIASVVLAGAGVGGFLFLKKGGDHKAKEEQAKKEDVVDLPKEKEKAILIQLDPFILNLSEPGRFVKLTIHLEVKNEKIQQYVNDRMPKIRDSIITLVSSKPADILATPEGKFQLKDELLLRVNQAIEKDLIKNIYFTEFVIQ